MEGVLLFPTEMGVRFDGDLLKKSKEGFETILEVGMGIGMMKSSK